MRLCLALGIAHPRLLFERIEWYEFCDWLALWEREPWGDLRADQRSAVAINYQLAAWSEDNGKLPELTYPYFQDDSVDPAAAVAAIEQHKARYGVV